MQVNDLLFHAHKKRNISINQYLKHESSNEKKAK